MEKFFEENNLKDAMCVSPKGELPLSNICNAQRWGYDMCPAHPFCYETLVKEASSMVNAGIDYAQLLDQNHGGTPYMCYSKEHGHPPVPGKWESEAAIKIMQKIKQNVGEGKMMFGCESSAAEVFIPELRFSDNRYEINFHFGMPVPLYAYIYHEYLHNFMGNQVGCEYSIDCRKSKEINVLYRLAYSFVAGDLMTLVINNEGKIQWAWGQFDFSDEYMPEQEDIMLISTDGIVIRMHGSNRNLLGPHHHVTGRNRFVGPSTFKGEWGWEDVFTPELPQEPTWTDAYHMLPFEIKEVAITKYRKDES